MKSVAFGTVLEKSAFCGKQICLFCSLQQHLRPRRKELPWKKQTAFAASCFAEKHHLQK